MFEFEPTEAEEIGGGGGDQWLSEPGTYLCQIMKAYEGSLRNGTPIDGFSVDMSVLAGTAEGQETKQYGLVLRSPDLSKSESSQMWARRKMTAFAVAANLISLSSSSGKTSVDLADSEGHQIFIVLEVDEYQKEKGKDRLQLAFDNIYHVDDPRAAKFPKSAEAIDLIDKKFRHDEAYFAPLMKKKEKAEPVPALSDADVDSL